MVYCIGAAAARRRASVPPPTGAPASLRWLQTDTLAALVAAVPERDEVAAMLDFARVIAHYHAHLDLVPMRWGSRFADADAVMTHLRRDGERYGRLLAELAGCVEMGVRLPLPESPLPPDAAAAAGAGEGTGRDYLLRRRAQLQVSAATEQALDRLDAALAGLYRQARREQGWFAGRRRLSAHYLVPRVWLEGFQRRLAAALADIGEPADAEPPLTSGPWPPHSFAATSVGDDAEATP